MVKDSFREWTRLTNSLKLLAASVTLNVFMTALYSMPPAGQEIGLALERRADTPVPQIERS
jgi:hypothetical protein